MPISLYSVTGQVLKRSGVKSVEELGKTVAGVTIGALNSQGAVVGQNGNPIQLTPKTKLGLTADYSFSLTDALQAQLTVRYRENSSTFSEITNREAERNPASKQLYIRAAVRQGDWEVGLYGDNLLNRNESNFTSRPITAIPLFFTTTVPPRKVGVDSNYRF